MSAGLARDLAALAALALLPALITLFLVRNRLTSTWPRFWGAMMYGLFGLALAGVIALGWTASMASSAEQSCRAARDAQGCDEIRYWVYAAAIPAIGALGGFAIGAAIIRAFAPRRL